MMIMSMSTAAAATTVIVGLNAALQKRFVLAPSNPSLIPGNVHRAQSVSTGIGGKGQDVYVTLHCLRYCCHPNDSDATADAVTESNVQLAQFLGQGPEGDQVASLLSSSLKDYYHDSTSASFTVRTQAPLRICTSVVGEDATTELVEPSGVVSTAEWDELLQRIRHHAANENVNRRRRPPSSPLSYYAGGSAVAFMGSLPPGCPTNAYAQIYEALLNNNSNNPNDNMISVIDSVAGLDELLQTMAQRSTTTTPNGHGQAMLKINASELARLVALPLRPDETAGVPLETVVEALTQWFVSKPAAVTALTAVALTDGAHAAHLAILDRSRSSSTAKDAAAMTTAFFDLYRLEVPNLSTHHRTNADNAPHVLYPIGAGDAVAAGTLAAWQCLLHSNNNNDDDDTALSFLPQDLTQILRQRAAATESDDTNRETHNILTTAFGFGLAVGSASCWQEENSVVDPRDCYQLFQQATPPTFLARHALPSMSSPVADPQPRAIAN